MTPTPRAERDRELREFLPAEFRAVRETGYPLFLGMAGRGAALAAQPNIQR